MHDNIIIAMISLMDIHCSIVAVGQGGIGISRLAACVAEEKVHDDLPDIESRGVAALGAAVVRPLPTKKSVKPR